jgi:hypothetical protein
MQSSKINGLTRKEEIKTVSEPTFAVEWRGDFFFVNLSDEYGDAILRTQVRSQLKKPFCA